MTLSGLCVPRKLQLIDIPYLSAEKRPPGIRTALKFKKSQPTSGMGFKAWGSCNNFVVGILREFFKVLHKGFGQEISFLLISFFV